MILVLLFRSAHFPTFRVKLHFGKRASLKKHLGHNFKASDFHSTCLLNPDKKIGKQSNSTTSSIFEVKSALNSGSKEKYSLQAVQHIPLHSAKSYIPGNELLYKKGLGHNPRFWRFTPKHKSKF